MQRLVNSCVLSKGDLPVGVQVMRAGTTNSTQIMMPPPPRIPRDTQAC